MAKKFEEIPFKDIEKTKIPINQLTTLYPSSRAGTFDLSQVRLCIRGEPDSIDEFTEFATGFIVLGEQEKLVHFSGRDLQDNKVNTEILAKQCGIKLPPGLDILLKDLSWFLNPRFYRPEITTDCKKLQSIFEKLAHPQRTANISDPAEYLAALDRKIVDATLGMADLKLLSARIREIAEKGLNIRQGDCTCPKLANYKVGTGMSKKQVKGNS